MILVVDVGNTRIKAAVFEGAMLLEVFVFSQIELEKNIKNILKNFKKTTDLVVSSVGDLGKQPFLAFDKEIKVHFISNKDSFPFQNKYATPQTLGIDRMVLAAGATLRYPDQNRLVIDAGTCITYDFIDQENNYLGGAISPGLRLRYEALHHYTAKLPLLSLGIPEDLIGKSTSESIHSGVVNGLVYEIDGFINQYKARYLNFIIILTGGDTDFLAKRLKNTIFANSNFLLESLNQTFQHKTKND
ncbi:type III pantothenate kinase [Flavobacterium sp. GSP27]|uniref:type III pantothenate kinase n=1 Tax=unclassified Flavobacterium TaxID=196869 RepID=UPI000F81ADF4|nr:MULTISPECIES: type III pantothenate kinase [unclassified Flavobacterium]RTY80977.1 type III pantothenate kinase [Flavobacterium sp. LS1P28]RTY93579.1 type III pantothenate kinase [Flavobacterium sp. GSN2]RTZ04437.1 type III pantothenate kinase [Flavobacterium sp. GSP6]RTZ08292.1 type III pantothenate kinase [Flavobacterium sp. GSP27]